MPLKPVTVFRGADLEHDNAFNADKWVEILLDLDKALSIEAIDLSKLKPGTTPSSADVSPPVIPPTVAGQPPTLQHTLLTRPTAPAPGAAPFPCVSIKFPNVVAAYTAKGEIKDFAEGGTPPKYEAKDKDGKTIEAEKAEPISGGGTYTPPKAGDKAKPVDAAK